MATFKVGDKIRMESDCRAGVPKSPKQGEVFELVEGSFGLSTGKDMYGCTCEEMWELITEPMTLETMVEGTIVKDEDGVFRKVLAVLGGIGEARLYAMSNRDRDLSSDSLKRYSDGYTAFDLKYYGYTIYSPTPEPEVVEMTLEEVAKLRGVDVSKLRIKE